MAEPTRVPASLDTIRWGAFDASFPPVATIDPGEVVILECLSGGPEVMPPQEKMMAVHPVLREVHQKLPRLGAHVITGPVAVRGAEPGDALRIDIEKIELGADWGFCGFRPLFGTLPEDFPYRRTLHIPVDREAMTCRLPFGPRKAGWTCRSPPSSA
jgi:acetamidase/formamidase